MNKNLQIIQDKLTTHFECTTLIECKQQIDDISEDLELLRIILEKEPYLYFIRTCENYAEYLENMGETPNTLTEKEFKAIKRNFR